MLLNRRDSLAAGLEYGFLQPHRAPPQSGNADSADHSRCRGQHLPGRHLLTAAPQQPPQLPSRACGSQSPTLPEPQLLRPFTGASGEPLRLFCSRCPPRMYSVFRLNSGSGHTFGFNGYSELTQSELFLPRGANGLPDDCAAEDTSNIVRFGANGPFCVRPDVCTTEIQDDSLSRSIKLTTLQ